MGLRVLLIEDRYRLDIGLLLLKRLLHVCQAILNVSFGEANCGNK